MARSFRTPGRRRRVVPEVPYYAPDVVGTERMVSTTTTIERTPDPYERNGAALWLLLIPLAILVALVAFLDLRDNEPEAVINPAPSPVAPTVIVVPGQPAPAPPPVVIQQPPVVVQQAPAATQPPPADQPSASANPAPASS